MSRESADDPESEPPSPPSSLTDSFGSELGLLPFANLTEALFGFFFVPLALSLSCENDWSDLGDKDDDSDCVREARPPVDSPDCLRPDAIASSVSVDTVSSALSDADSDAEDDAPLEVEDPVSEDDPLLLKPVLSSPIESEPEPEADPDGDDDEEAVGFGLEPVFAKRASSEDTDALVSDKLSSDESSWWRTEEWIGRHRWVRRL